MKGLSIAALVFVAAFSPAAAVTLTFAQAPDITFEIPAGWSACDAPTRAALHGPPPNGELKDLCKDYNDKGGARAIGTPDGSVMMSFVLTKPDEFPPSYFKAVTPKTISGLSAGLCQRVFQAPPGEASCVFTLRNIANRNAMAGWVRPPNGRFDFGRMLIVPGGQRSAAFILLTKSPTADTNVRMDAIVASIRVSEKGR
jgi:hypothetical protein